MVWLGFPLALVSITVFSLALSNTMSPGGELGFLFPGWTLPEGAGPASFVGLIASYPLMLFGLLNIRKALRMKVSAVKESEMRDARTAQEGPTAQDEPALR